MKTIILIMLTALSFNVLTQTTEKKTLYKGSFSITQKIQDSDTSTFFSFTYQNQKYQHISDLGIILTFDKASVKQLAELLMEFSQKDPGVQVSHKTKDYTIDLYDFSRNIYLTDTKGKYTAISKKQAIKMADEIFNNLHLLR